MNSELDWSGISSVDTSKARRAVNVRTPQKLRKPERDELELADLVELYVTEQIVVHE
jgi:hypothetical protein